MKTLFAFFGSVLAFVVCWPAMAQPVSPTIPVSLEIYRGGVVIGTPSIAVEAGKPAIITVKREGGYSMRVTVNELKSTSALRQFSVKSEIYIRQNDRWSLLGSPAMTIMDRQAGFIEVVRSGGALGELFRMRVLIDTSKIVPISAIQRLNSPCSKKSLALRKSEVGNRIARPILVQFSDTNGSCCSTGCLTCCGASGTYCSDSTNCSGGCCT